MLERLARTCYRRRRLVVVGWVVALIAFSFLASAAGGKFKADFRMPNTESQRAFDVLKAKFPAQSGDTGTIVYRADKGVNDPAVRQAMEGMFAKVAAVEHVQAVRSPYQPGPGAARQVSPDGKTAFATIQFTTLDRGKANAVASPIKDAAAATRAPGLQVELGGQMFSNFKPPASEGIGVLAAIFILLIAFGSVLAMGLPIATALVGIGCGVAVVKLLAAVMSVPDFATQVASMIGLGVGIDYALFIITRYRSGLHDGMEPEHAVVTALNTAGRAVVFAGCTVVISVMGMFLMGVSFVKGLAVGASAAVLLVMAASITLLPALLGFTGRKIDWLRLFKPKGGGSEKTSVWYRWSRLVQRRPWPAFVAGLAILIALAIPVFSLRLGSSDAGNDPKAQTTRQAYDLLSQGFGPGFNGPLLLAAELPGPQGMQALQRLQGSLQSTPGVAFVTPPQPNQAGDTAVLQVFPTTSPQDAKTTKLIHTLRAHVIPTALAGSGVTVHVGGITAVFNDMADVLGARLPLFIGAVLILSFLLLMVVFRSILVPLKAVVMNLLSIGAAFGLLVAIFQWGWASNLVGVGKAGPIETWAPMMLFAIVFGLSMDYEIFLLSRVQEEYHRTGDNATAVADGLSNTARVITAAAAIMVCVFGSFALGDNRILKLMGLGLASAVFIDATLVRMLLVPATMELLGDRNWWFPKWLDRIVPRISIESPEPVGVELAPGAGELEEPVPVG